MRIGIHDTIKQMSSIVKDPDVVQGSIMIYSKLDDGKDELKKIADKFDRNAKIA